MGDKSPKAKNRARKQTEDRKTQQKEAAALKASKPVQETAANAKKP